METRRPVAAALFGVLVWSGCWGIKLGDNDDGDTGSSSVRLPREGTYTVEGQNGGDGVCIGYAESDEESHHSWSEEVRVDGEVFSGGPFVVQDVTEDGFLMVVPNYLLPSDGTTRELPCTFDGFVEGTTERQFYCEPFQVDFSVGDGVVSILTAAGGRFVDPCTLRFDLWHQISCEGETVCDDWVAECTGVVDPSEYELFPGIAFIWLTLECAE